MLNRRHDLMPGSSIGVELIGDHSAGYATLLAQETLQQALGRLGIAAGLGDLIEDIAILVDGSPEPVLLAGAGDHDLVEMLDVAPAWCLASEAVGVIRSKLQSPPADGLI